MMRLGTVSYDPGAELKEFFDRGFFILNQVITRLSQPCYKVVASFYFFFNGLCDIVSLSVVYTCSHQLLFPYAERNLKQQINKIRSNVTHFKRTLQTGNTASPSCK